MFKSYKFNKKLEKKDIKNMSEAEKKMFEFAEDLANKKSTKSEKPDTGFVNSLADRLTSEFNAMHQAEDKKSFDWNSLIKSFNPLTIPVAALGLVYLIYLAFSGNQVSNEIQRDNELRSELLAYEESLSDFEEDLTILDGMSELSEEVEFNSI